MMQLNFEKANEPEVCNLVLEQQDHVFLIFVGSFRSIRENHTHHPSLEQVNNKEKKWTERETQPFVTWTFLFSA